MYKASDLDLVCDECGSLYQDFLPSWMLDGTDINIVSAKRGYQGKLQDKLLVFPALEPKKTDSSRMSRASLNNWNHALVKYAK